jgi:hypothetical protein
LQSTKKLYKTTVFVHFGLELQRVSIDDWQQKLKDISAAHLASTAISNVYELPIDHGISYKCCTKIILDPYSRPALTVHKEVRRPGRPRIQ